MKEHPIILKAEMVQAILDGRKTMTRRVVTSRNSEVGVGRVDWSKFDFYAQTFANKDLIKIMGDGAEVGSIADISVKNSGRAPAPWVDNSVPNWQYLHVPYNWTENGTIYRIYPKWEVGDRLWVRETWADMVCVSSTEKGKGKGESNPHYKASSDATELKILQGSWKPSIHMPRWASRITLEITEIRVERVQDITLADIQAEGIPDNRATYNAPIQRDKFKTLWNSINAKRGYGWEVNPWVWVISFKVVK